MREIHSNQPYNDDGNPVLPRSAGRAATQSTQGVQMLDRHLPIQERDLDPLRWTLARAPKVEVINLESHEPSEAALMEAVWLVRGVVG